MDNGWRLLIAFWLLITWLGCSGEKERPPVEEHLPYVTRESTTTTTEDTDTESTTSTSQVSWNTCEACTEATCPIYELDDRYHLRIDLDSDGIACENPDFWGEQ